MESASLREKAAKCRRLAAGLSDDQAATALRRLADSYDQQAAEADAQPPADQPPPPAQAD